LSATPSLLTQGGVKFVQDGRALARIAAGRAAGVHLDRAQLNSASMEASLALLNGLRIRMPCRRRPS
jgi:hypothetical protein